MSQEIQTSATSFERPTAIRREVVWNKGAVVRVKVPTGAKRASYVGDDMRINYFLFDQSVKNGGVRCHVHLKGEETPELRGTEVSAKVELWKKTLSNGREYLYLDFHLVPDSAVVTHRFGVVPRASDVTLAEGWEIFETPQPLQGAVIFTPPDAKLALSQADKGEAFLARLREACPFEEELKSAQSRIESDTQSLGESLAIRWGARVTKKK